MNRKNTRVVVRRLIIFLITFFSVLSVIFITITDEPASSERELGLPELNPLEDDIFVNERSAIGTPENPNARQEYFFNMLKDPKTQSIPAGIRSKELRFSETLPAKQSSGSAFRTQLIDWNSIGPFNVGGRTRAIGIDAANEEVLMAGGVSGGMWRSEDGGIQWELVTTPQNLHSVTCIAQDTRPGNTKTWYYGTGEIQGNSARTPFAPYRGDGIFKSIDGGKTWQLLESTSMGEPTRFNSQFQYTWNVVTNPFNQENDEVLAAIVGAIVRSTDGGETWNYILGEQYTGNGGTDLNESQASRFSDIRITSDGTYYACLSSAGLNGIDTNAGIYRSEDGVNWAKITPAGWPINFQRVVIGTSPENPDEVYFLCNIEEGSNILWKYTYVGGYGQGFGGRWNNLTSNIPNFGGDLGDYNAQGSYNMMIKVHPEDPETVFIGGTNLYRSTNGYLSTEQSAWIGGYDTANDFNIYNNHYVDQHDVVFYPSDPDKMLSVNDGGVFKCNNNKAEKISWIPLNNGFVTSQYYTIAFDDHSGGGTVIGGLQDNGTQVAKSPDAISQWRRFLGGDGGFSAVSKDQQYVYASFQDGQIYRFTVNNDLDKTSFARIDPVGGGEAEDQGYLFVNPYVLDPNNNNILYLAGGNVVWRNNNVTQIPPFRQEKTDINWEIIDDSEIESGQISAMSITTNPAHTVYFGTSFGKLYKIMNAHSINEEVSEITSSDFPDNGYLKSIAVNKNNGDELFITFSNYNIPSIFYSSDGGQSFTDVSGNLEENPDGTGNGPSVRWGEIVPLRNGDKAYFVATSTGVYSTQKLEGAATTWEQESAETIGNVVSVMVKHRNNDGAVFVATHGRGLFRGILGEVENTQYDQSPVGLNFESPYPNPFVEEIKIPFNIPEDGPVRVKILNLLGQDVKTLMWGYLYAGKNQVTWDGKNPTGTPVTEGIYLCQIEYKDQKIAKRLFFYK